MKKRAFVPNTPHHVYFISSDGSVLFYRVSDRLSFYTTLSVLAKRYKVTVTGVAIMFTHVHLMVQAADLAQFRQFMSCLLQAFSRILRQDRGLTGPVFRSPFGSAPQVSSKRQRSSLIYLLNNPVEKHLCNKAVQDRWNFLAYYDNPHPYSKQLVKRNVSEHLRDACSLVEAEARAGRFLRPALLRHLLRNLIREEQEQLTDHIIWQYRFIDFETAIALFGGYDRLLRTTEETNGQEFGVGETGDSGSDTAYLEMAGMAARAGLFENWALLHLDPDQQQAWFRKFRTHTHATDWQIRKFLGIRER